MGLTEPVGEGRPVFSLERRRQEPESLTDGWASRDFRIWGSYIHGLFDRDGFRRAWLADLRREKGLDQGSRKEYDFEKFQEEQFDRLAGVVRSCVDVDFLMQLIQLSKKS
jgi:adenosylcobyric acid synthase